MSSENKCCEERDICFTYRFAVTQRRKSLSNRETELSTNIRNLTFPAQRERKPDECVRCYSLSGEHEHELLMIKFYEFIILKLEEQLLQLQTEQ